MSASDFVVPERAGEKPVTPDWMPHLQHTENSSEALFQELADWLFALEYIEKRRSRVSIPSTVAAWISESYADVHPMANREFTHIHTEPGPGSQHMTLRTEDASEVLGKGWGEYHPINEHIGQPGIDMVMVYAPRDEGELEVVKQIIMRAYQFALNKL